MDEIKEQLIQFIREEIREFKLPIGLSTQIEDDLGVTGVDAEQLIKSISKKFGVDISEFNYEKYFHPEPSLFYKYGKIEPLTIQNIIDGVVIGKLI